MKKIIKLLILVVFIMSIYSCEKEYVNPNIDGDKIDTTLVDTTDYAQLTLDSILNSLDDEWFIDSIIIQITHDADSIIYENGYFDIGDIWIMDFAITYYYNDWFWYNNDWSYPIGRYHRFKYKEVKYFKYERNNTYYLKPAFIFGAPDKLMIYPGCPINTKITEKYIQLYISDYVNIY